MAETLRAATDTAGRHALLGWATEWLRTTARLAVTRAQRHEIENVSFAVGLADGVFAETML